MPPQTATDTSLYAQSVASTEPRYSIQIGRAHVFNGGMETPRLWGCLSGVVQSRSKSYKIVEIQNAQKDKNKLPPTGTLELHLRPAKLTPKKPKPAKRRHAHYEVREGIGYTG